MRISDWSSDVCSSDLAGAESGKHAGAGDVARVLLREEQAHVVRPPGHSQAGQVHARLALRADDRVPVQPPVVVGEFTIRGDDRVPERRHDASFCAVSTSAPTYRATTLPRAWGWGERRRGK